MTDEEFDQELHYYQQAIQDAHAQDPYAHVKGYSLWEEIIPEAIARFKSLAEQDRPRFLQLCFTLLEDPRREIRVGYSTHELGCEERTYSIGSFRGTIERKKV